ncbi:type II toxin-antitoxin system HicB family antitoxin [Sphingomonas populi]|uniref:Type II toxin-antitoxin system HicB family antitoxin n=1 Tax=Sphingomonas populi TaxID=2484750 RepID=A0A4Q6XVI3_9SPHN|nr:type II toxin-antitoxin system HicB family antitoxin [Sphingomonas populi]RZF64005.1 type II toxin-antitoxin system HicB family antitoxin [Sphingomonas populi]
MSAYDYEIDVRPLPESLGGGYLATAPDLPGCMADGETPEEALAAGYDAAAAWLETAAELGRDIPAPKMDERLYA